MLYRLIWVGNVRTLLERAQEVECGYSKDNRCWFVKCVTCAVVLDVADKAVVFVRRANREVLQALSAFISWRWQLQSTKNPTLEVV